MQLTRSGHPRWRPSQLILVFSDSSLKADLRDSHVETQMKAWAKGHAARPSDAGFSNSRPAVARVQRSNSTALNRASDRIIRAATSASCPLHASAERAPLFPGAGSLLTAEAGVERWKRQAWRSGAGVVGRWPELARSRERAVVEQSVEADEAGASDGASPLNAVFSDSSPKAHL